VKLQAATGRTIEFQTQNRIDRFGTEPERFDLPHLTLFSNNLLTDPVLRTLNLEVVGLQVPPSGATVSLQVETQHGEPVPGEARWERIPVWQETRVIPAHNEGDQPEERVTFTLEFTENTVNAGEQVRTPSDYYRYQIRVTGVDDLANTTLYNFGQDYAFLLENQWVTPLPEVPEESPSAAPDQLVIYYCDMTPFQKDIHDPATWVPRETVNEYVGNELLPKMVEAFRIQSQDWGFPWYEAWTSARKGEDAERLSVALTDGKTWYHGQAFPRGNSYISINVAGGENYSYNTLADGVQSTFHHELFHNHQRNINQHYGGKGWIGGKVDQWQFFAEGTAVLASAVAQPEIQFAPDAHHRAYITNANLYLGSATIRGDIGKDFSEISPYHAALYWRFLYEQCGGLSDGVENPAAGLQIIRSALTSLYQSIEGDGNETMEFVSWVPRILDQALGGTACPFQTYAQSLTAFAQAVNALRVETGRCQSPGLPEGCGFYDPHHLYNDPPANTLALMEVSP
jgi:hypothetical protein